MKRKKLLVTVSVIALVAAGTTAWMAPLAAEPEGDKDCGNVLPQVGAERFTKASFFASAGALPKADSATPAVPEPRWAQRGGAAPRPAMPTGCPPS